jgi:hypothetical protein
MPVRGLNNHRPLPVTTTGVNGIQPTTTSTTQPNSLPSLDANRSASNEVVMSPAVREKVTANLDSFYSKLRTTLNHDAMSLARGESPIRAGDSLTEGQQNELKDAAVDMLKGMPIGALSPQATEMIRGVLDSRGVDSSNLETKTLDQLGDVGGDLAKKLVDDLKADKPAVFYGVAAAAAAAIGTYGYLEGSEKLRDLGIKPEYKTKLFNKKLEVKAEADWGKKFSDPNLRLSTRGTTSLGSLMIGHHMSYDTRNADNVSGGLDIRNNGRNHIGVRANGDLENGLSDASIYGRYHIGDHTTVNGSANFDGDLNFTGANVNSTTRFNDSGNLRLDLNVNEEGALRDVGAGMRLNGDNWNVSGNVRHNFIEDRTTGRVSAGYNPSENFEVGAFGELDTRGESRVGVGLTWRF